MRHGLDVRELHAPALAVHAIAHEQAVRAGAEVGAPLLELEAGGFAAPLERPGARGRRDGLVDHLGREADTVPVDLRAGPAQQLQRRFVQHVDAGLVQDADGRVVDALRDRARP